MPPMGADAQQARSAKTMARLGDRLNVWRCRVSMVALEADFVGGQTEKYRGRQE
jgi:hypothetical protein